MSETRKSEIIELETKWQNENPSSLELYYSEVPDVSKERIGEKISFLENEVKEMRNKVKRIKGLMYRGEELKMVLNFPQMDESLEPENRNGSDYTTYLREIEKMDAVLKIKAAEEKKVRLSRLQIEEESKEILMELPKIQVPKAVKVNSQEFINLLSEFDRDIVDEKEDGKKYSSEEKEEVEKSRKKDNVERNEGAKFVLRNIQLAKCGRGTLSMTEDEELRVKTLLKDLDECDSNEEVLKKGRKCEEEIYAFDEETQSKLSSIDKRLEEFTKKKILDCSPTRLTKLSQKKEEIDINESDKKQELKKKKKKTSRLREINNLLKYLNSETSEEIDPLPQSELEYLIEEARESFGEFSEVKEKDEEQTEKNHIEDEKKVKLSSSKEELAEMVASAKSLMPKFKYRYE